MRQKAGNGFMADQGHVVGGGPGDKGSDVQDIANDELRLGAGYALISHYSPDLPRS